MKYRTSKKEIIQINFMDFNVSFQFVVGDVFTRTQIMKLFQNKFLGEMRESKSKKKKKITESIKY